MPDAVGYRIKFGAIVPSTNTVVEADYNRMTPTQTFNVTPLSPGGVFTDPQVGATNQFRTIDFSNYDSNQRTFEVRLQSSFGGRFDLSAGASYLRYKTISDYYVTSNTLTAVTEGLFNANTPGCPLTGSLSLPQCQYVDPSAIPLDSVGCVTLQRSAARLNESSVAAAAAKRSWLRFIYRSLL